ncbi:MAG: Ig-like domain-containing protein [Anaerolineae bacterium]|nr:Ig-like domain-containing protein [Anaerolineae bacterium]
MIDGSYRIEIAGLQAGDQLSLRAAGAEDSFEPLSYQWQAEAGIDTWRYDFYSYWGTITPPASNDQNRIYGYVRDAQGAGVPGLTLLLQVGTSDALQVLGPTDANGYYETLVRLPDRVMVTVWVQTSGYSPSRLQFFHAYAPEDREASFVHVL